MRLVEKNTKNNPNKKQLYDQYLHLKKNIETYGTQFRVPLISDNYKKIDSHSWFDINVCEENNFKFSNFDITYEKLSNSDDGYTTKFIELFPTENQKQILDTWMQCYVLMYNTTIKYLKNMKHKKNH